MVSCMNMDTAPNRIKSCLQYLTLKEGDFFLNVGCGADRRAELYAVQQGCRTFAIDISCAKLPVNGGNRLMVNYLQGNALSLPFRNGTFSKIAMLEVLEHLPVGTEKLALSEIFRVLKKNGTFVISVPNKRFLAMILDPPFLTLSHRHYSRAELMRLVHDVGFCITSVYEYGGIKQASLMLVYYIFAALNRLFLVERLPELKVLNVFQKYIGEDYEFPKKRGCTIVFTCQKD